MYKYEPLSYRKVENPSVDTIDTKESIMVPTKHTVEWTLRKTGFVATNPVLRTCATNPVLSKS
jgi:hypothetical protein